MRKSAKKQLRRYLLGYWLFSTGLLVVAVYVTTGSLDATAIQIIGITAIGSLGFFLQLLDVWLKTETEFQRHRSKSGNHHIGQAK